MKLTTQLFGLLLITSTPAWATDSTASNDRIGQLEKRVEAMQQEID